MKLKTALRRLSTIGMIIDTDGVDAEEVHNVCDFIVNELLTKYGITETARENIKYAIAVQYLIFRYDLDITDIDYVYKDDKDDIYVGNHQGFKLKFSDMNPAQKFNVAAALYRTFEDLLEETVSMPVTYTNGYNFED